MAETRALQQLTANSDWLTTLGWTEASPPQAWPMIVRAAEQHGMAGVLLARLNQSGQLDALPSEPLYALRRAAHHTRLRNQFMLDEAERLVTTLEAAGIRPLLLKGMALLLTVYHDPSLRPMRDVDVWVRPEDLQAALTQLAAAGWIACYPEQATDNERLFMHHVALRRDDPLAGIVELHHRWLSLPARLARLMPEADVWQRAVQTCVGRTPAWVLAPEDQVLHLAAHTAWHLGNAQRLIWLCDLERVIRSAGATLDWSAVTRRAAEMRAVLPLQRTLPTAVAQFGAPVPEAVLAEIAALPVHKDEQAWYGENALRRRSSLVAVWQRLSGLETRRAQLHFARSVAWPAREAMVRSYPDAHGLRLLARYSARWLTPLRETRSWRRQQRWQRWLPE